MQREFWVWRVDIIHLMDRNFHRLLYYELLFIEHITFEMMDRIRMLMMMTVMKYLFQYLINIDRQHAWIENPVARCNIWAEWVSNIYAVIAYIQM